MTALPSTGSCFPSPDMTCSYPNLSVLPLLYIIFSCLYFTVQPSWTSLRQCVLWVGVLQVGGDVVLGVDHLPNQDSALLIRAGLSDTTTYQATVYRLSIGPIKDNQADFPPILHLVACPVEVTYYSEPLIMP